MAETVVHLDCRNYAPVDVTKGICHLRKRMVLADDPACEMFEKLPKCKQCAKYVPREEEHLGICTATSYQALAYPDLIAFTCEWFSWKEP